MKTEITQFEPLRFNFLSGLKSQVYTQVIAECAYEGHVGSYLQLIELSRRKSIPQNVVEEQGLAELCKFIKTIQN